MCADIKLFTFPSEEILVNEKKGIYSNHYSYSNGEYGVHFSHNYGSLSVSISKHNVYTDKYWEIHNITKSSLKTLEERINKYLIKQGAIGKLYDIYCSDYKKLYYILKENGILDKEHNHFIEVVEHQKAINIEDEKLITHKITANNFYSWYQISSDDEIINVEHLTINSYIKLIEYMKSLI